MPNSEPPTMGEIMRKLESVTEQIGDVVKEMREERREAAGTYVRKDVYLPERQWDQAVVSDLSSDLHLFRKDIDTRAATDLQFRRQVLLLVASSTLAALTAFAVALFTLVAK